MVWCLFLYSGTLLNCYKSCCFLARGSLMVLFHAQPVQCWLSPPQRPHWWLGAKACWPPEVILQESQPIYTSESVAAQTGSSGDHPSYCLTSMPKFTPNVLCCGAVVRRLGWMVTKMEQPEKSLNHSPGEHIWTNWGMQPPTACRLRVSCDRLCWTNCLSSPWNVLWPAYLCTVWLLCQFGDEMCETKPSLSHMENTSMINVNFREFHYISVSIRRQDVFSILTISTKLNKTGKFNLNHSRNNHATLHHR